MDEIAHSVNLFYDKYPYPSLPIRNESDLVDKLHANVMSKILATARLEPVSLSGKKILDAGCGTGEKSCYFSYYGAEVTAVDRCISSIEKAKELAEKFKLQVSFTRCDIAELDTEERYDHIFCLGVLHHSSNPYRLFRMIASLCKPGGTVTIGLYNQYGRFAHRVRRMWIALNAGDDIERRISFIEKSIYGRKLRGAHEKAYAADKYANPYESYHSVGEIIEWFNKNNIEYMGCHPHTGKGKLQSLFSQLGWLLQRKGFFIISGRKIG